VVTLELKYKRPARFDEELRIVTTIRRTETATLEFLCDIVGADGASCASGRTVHVLTDKNGTLQYSLPAVIAERIEKMLSYLEV
jgi:acyl-CoA thioester hydrolase